MPKEIIEILDAMHEYLKRDDHSFHNNLRMAYCGSCESIVAVGGDYTVSAGRDCDGDHYKTERHNDECVGCKSTKFIEISKYNMLGFSKKYGEKAPDLLLKAIQNGLKEMKFPCLYNEKLPEIADGWHLLDRKEKISQINSLLSINKEYKQAKAKVKLLEESLK